MTTEFADHFLFNKQRMIVNKFSTMDQDIVSFFKDFTEPSELEEKFEKILKIGVIVAKTIGMVHNVDYIQKEFNSLISIIMDKIKEHFVDNSKILKDALDPHKQDTPTYSLMKSIETELDDMKIQLGISKEVEQIKQKTPLKGLDFEKYCEDTLSDIARFHGDDLEVTGTTSGRINKSKKGDYVVTLGNNIGKRLVFEVKDIQEISLKDIHDELEEAKKNRDADYGIFVVKNVESIPKSIGWFNEYNGGKLVCALGNEESSGLLHGEILCIAYKWAKLKLSTDSLREKKIDVTFVNEKADAILLKLNSFNQIGTQCGNIIKSAEEIKKITANTKAQITEDLNKIIDSISSSYQNRDDQSPGCS